jgi:hypothetical protein
MFVHHDVPPPDFPLCTPWMDFNPKASMEEKHRNFIGFNSCSNFSSESLWNTGINPTKPSRIPMGCIPPCKFWRKISKRSNLL